MDKISLDHPAIHGDIERARRVIEARTTNRFLKRGLPILAGVIAILAVGYLSGHAVAMQESASPTVASLHDCSDYTGDPAAVADGLDGACALPTIYHGSPTLDTADYGTDIPRCASDDWNSTGLPRCYTERVTDGAVLIIDQADNVIGTIR